MNRRRQLIAAVIVGGLAAGLAACGFEPLYGERGPDNRSVAADLAAIKISPIANRLGLELYNHLRDRLGPGGEPARPRYLLVVDLRTDTNARVTARDSQIRRFDLRLRAEYTLVDAATNAPLDRGRSHVVAAFNVVESASFATRVAEQDAGRKAAREVSEQITTMLALYFERQRRG